MRWFSFFILTYLALGLQSGLARAIEFDHAAPDFVLLAAVFIALNAPHDTALLACFILGVLSDLAFGGTMGLFAFVYGMVGIFIASAQRAIGYRHPAAHFILTLSAGLIAAVILALHAWLRPPLAAGHYPVLPLFSSALYTAILAPVVLGILQKFRGVFRFHTSRGRM
jgi:rod shape-determining protein MreD